MRFVLFQFFYVQLNVKLSAGSHTDTVYTEILCQEEERERMYCCNFSLWDNLFIYSIFITAFICEVINTYFYKGVFFSLGKKCHDNCLTMYNTNLKWLCLCCLTVIKCCVWSFFTPLILQVHASMYSFINSQSNKPIHKMQSESALNISGELAVKMILVINGQIFFFNCSYKVLSMLSLPVCNNQWWGKKCVIYQYPLIQTAIVFPMF